MDYVCRYLVILSLHWNSVKIIFVLRHLSLPHAGSFNSCRIMDSFSVRDLEIDVGLSEVGSFFFWRLDADKANSAKMFHLVNAVPNYRLSQ